MAPLVALAKFHQRLNQYSFVLAKIQMNLVDWFKGMVASRRGEELVDPLIEVKPSPRSLKRALLVCLRCIDLDPNKRPKMGQIVHMLEADEFPFRSVSPSHSHSTYH